MTPKHGTIPWQVILQPVGCWVKIPSIRGFPWVMGVPQARWMVFVNVHPIYKWMMTGGTPMTLETSIRTCNRGMRSCFPSSQHLTTRFSNPGEPVEIVVCWTWCGFDRKIMENMGISKNIMGCRSNQLLIKPSQDGGFDGKKSLKCVETKTNIVSIEEQLIFSAFCSESMLVFQGWIWVDEYQTNFSF